jgi:hypothetical protein
MIILIIIIVTNAESTTSFLFGKLWVPAALNYRRTRKRRHSKNKNGAKTTIKVKRTPSLPVPCPHGAKRAASCQDPRVSPNNEMKPYSRISARDDSSFIYILVLGFDRLNPLVLIRGTEARYHQYSAFSK